MKAAEKDTVLTLLSVVADLLRGTQHSRRTIADATGKSLPTADRWLDQIEEALPNMRRFRDGKTTWLVHDGRNPPSRSAAAGACVAASLAAMFEGSVQERNLLDARDHILRERGESFENLERKFVLAPRGGEYALPQEGPSLDTIVEALLRNQRLHFDYKHNDGSADSATIAPLSLVLYEHQFYVLAERGAGFYPYRFARMKNVERIAEEFSYPTKSVYDPKGLLAQAFGIHIHGTGPIEDIEVILSGAWAAFALTHKWHPMQRSVPIEEGRVRVTFQARVCRELETWVLGFGEFVHVVRPERLRDSIVKRLKQAMEVYEPPPAARPRLTMPTRRAKARRSKRRAS